MSKQVKILIAGLLVSFGFLAQVNAQYYYPEYNQNYYWNQPNGTTQFIGDNYYNNRYYNGYNSYNNYNSGYYYNNNNNWNGYYNNFSVTPVYPYQNYNYNNYYNNYSIAYPTTAAATYVGQTTGTINGSVTYSSNGYNSNNYGQTWFEYGTGSNNFAWSTNRATIYGSTNSNAHLTGLTCGTTYYFRAVASVNGNIQYGNTLSFTTNSCGYYQNYYPGYNTYYQPRKVKTNCTRRY